MANLERETERLRALSLRALRLQDEASRIRGGVARLELPGALVDVLMQERLVTRLMETERRVNGGE